MAVYQWLRKDSTSEALEARRLVELRDRWLNPPEWVQWVDEPVPCYPKRLIPRDEEAAKALKKRTLTNLYNARPQGRSMHATPRFSWELLALNSGGR